MGLLRLCLGVCFQGKAYKEKIRCFSRTIVKIKKQHKNSVASFSRRALVTNHTCTERHVCSVTKNSASERKAVLNMIIFRFTTLMRFVSSGTGWFLHMA
eukprot:2633657-Amphidinium_carterae.1